MLMLGRKENERIALRNRETGETICVVVLCHIGAETVKIGFEAPLWVEIVRTELIRDGIDTSGQDGSVSR